MGETSTDACRIIPIHLTEVYLQTRRQMSRRFRAIREEQIERLPREILEMQERNRQRKCQIKSRIFGKKQTKT